MLCNFTDDKLPIKWNEMQNTNKWYIKNFSSKNADFSIKTSAL